ncbi:rRNA-processing protein utp21 [Microbotryomycetes sp. JL221]|nr:rRNA-processing protein utp21 [Microbotryomycetes sp. JL221]
MTRPTKRTRTGISSDTQHESVSNGRHSPAQRQKLFEPFRTLGHVSTKVPLQVVTRTNKFLKAPNVTVLTSMGRNWAMWDGQQLRLVFVGPDMGSELVGLAATTDSVYATSLNKLEVSRFVRGTIVQQFVTQSKGKSKAFNSQSNSDDSDSDSDEVMSSSLSSSSSSSSSSSTMSDEDDDEQEDQSAEHLHSLTVFGSTLIALSSLGRRMFVWDIPPFTKPASSDPSRNQTPTTKSVTVTPYTVLEFPEGFVATKLVHPASYLNKVVVASQLGQLAVWNVRTGALIHTFESNELHSRMPSPVTALTQSPAIDVLGVGLADGQCVLFDVRMGESLGKVRLEGEGCGEVAGVGFRNDAEGQTLAVTSTTGHIALFDLSNKLRLLHLVRAAHEGPVGGLEWVPGQPLMMTSGGDNSLKQWLFDTPSAAPRVLKQRSGHHAPPHLVRHYGEDGKAILTAGADHALRYTSVVRDSRGYELSQGSILKKANHLGVKPSSLKLPLVTGLSWSTSRTKEWDDVVTVSQKEALGRSWSVHDKRIGKHTLPAGAPAKTCCVTACGNFGLVGAANGEVTMYNMQSGMKRKTFKVPHGGVGDVRGKHITGIAIDALNRAVVVSTLKGGLHLMRLVSSLQLSASITAITLQRENNLMATVCDDLTIRIVDIETRRVVRELTGPRGQILDVAFSPDSRWIMSTSQDSIIRTFDIPTGQLVDAFRVPSVATSLSFSPSSDFLATCHVGSLGVHLWANRAQFTEVPLRAITEEDLEEVSLPTVQGGDEDVPILSELRAPSRWEDLQPYTTPDQLSDDLLTLSLMPRSRWQTLLNLETIKQRNKPKQPPKAPESAPFFLPTVAGLEARFDVGSKSSKALNVDDKAEQEQRRKLDFATASVETEFVRKLMAEDEEGDYQSFFEYLKALSPSLTDLELRSLVSLSHLSKFLNAISQRLSTHRDFEAVQTYLAMFLRIHGDVIVENEPELGPLLRKIKQRQATEANRLLELTQYALGTLSFLRSTPIA